MGSHPINLGLRFILEVLALAAMGYWGSQQSTGIIRILLAIAIPVVAMALWVTFAVPGDPSRSGEAPVVTPGWVRLLLELAIFGTAVLMLLNLGVTTLSVVFAVVVITHYLVSYDRIIWLLQQ